MKKELKCSDCDYMFVIDTDIPASIIKCPNGHTSRIIIEKPIKDDIRKQLWCDVYLKSDGHEEIADKAIGEYDKRFTK